ncbi:hypothetical protein [Streptomyces sp. NRRL S-337]|uniref:hypothetical protein n=1 Tax=Streptomyces sp. NRRL S-337 TaxID=1463900 RepID=UPI0004C69AFE|nr:hypothetical protein [Streptomyces sp. NRRL S-337]
MNIGWDTVPASNSKTWTVDEITGNACPCCHFGYSLAREKITGPDDLHVCRPCAARLGLCTEAEAAL